MLRLVTGGSCSGKSAFAEKLAIEEMQRRGRIVDARQAEGGGRRGSGDGDDAQPDQRQQHQQQRPVDRPEPAGSSGVVAAAERKFHRGKPPTAARKASPRASKSRN